MTKNSAQPIVHESETQRQFVRLPVPSQATVGEKSYYIKDLSSGGVAIVDVQTTYVEGTRFPISLNLPFSSFSLQLVLDVQVKYYLPQEKILGCQFIGLNADQVALINHVIKSFMAGEIVKSGDVLNVAARDNFTKPRGKKITSDGKPVVNLKRQIPGLVLVAVLGLAALTFIGANLYESLFVMKSNNAFVQGPVTQVRAVEQGVFVSKLPAGATTVKNRQEIGAVGENDLKSPCDCLIVTQHRQDGEFVVPGDPILSLVPTESQPWIVALLKPEEARRLTLDGAVRISVAGTKIEFPGKVASIKADMAEPAGTDFASALGGGSRQVQVRIVPEQKIPSELINRPARVIFEIK